MKAFRLLPFLAALVAGGYSGLVPAPADPDDSRVQGALAAANHWLAEIDAGQYEKSYAEGCTAFHNKVTQNEWLTVMKVIRTPLGTLVSRKEATHVYKPDGIEGLEGECMVITYNTAFSKLDSDLEVVVLKREDGVWRGAGYNAQPQSPDPNSTPPPDVQQQTSSQSSVTPQPTH